MKRTRATTICIIDDDAVLRATWRHVLEDAGHKVVEASNGRDGVELVHSCGASVAIVDIIMPDQEGLETIRALMERNPLLSILAVSGFDQHYLKMAMIFGAADCLRKPFLGSELTKRVNQILERRALLELPEGQ